MRSITPSVIGKADRQGLSAPTLRAEYVGLAAPPIAHPDRPPGHETDPPPKGVSSRWLYHEPAAAKLATAAPDSPWVPHQPSVTQDGAETEGVTNGVPPHGAAGPGAPAPVDVESAAVTADDQPVTSSRWLPLPDADPPPAPSEPSQPIENPFEPDPAATQVGQRRVLATLAYFGALFEEPLASTAAQDALRRFAEIATQFSDCEGQAADECLLQIARATAASYESRGP
jgi:hypothetical protein